MSNINESKSQNIENMTSKELSKVLNSGVSGFRHNFTKNIISHLNSVLTNIVTSRHGYFIELAKYRDNYLVEGIYDILSNDIILDVSSNKRAITVSIPDYDEDIQKEITELFDDLNIVEVIQSILPDLLHYGSYPLRPIIRKGKGIIDLVDDLSPARVMPITDSKNNPLFYFISDSDILFDSSIANNVKDFKFSYFPITDIINFSLDLSFKKVVLPDETINNIHNNNSVPDLAKKLLPQAVKVKVSKSFIWPVIDKIKELIALDKMNIYNSIGRLLTPKIVGVPVPNNYGVDQTVETMSRYEELLNSNIQNTNDITSLDVTLKEMSQIKVVPIVGDRSDLRPMDVGSDTRNSDPEAFNNSLDTALNSLGISPELFRGTVSSYDSMKTNVRYAKKIKRIQKNISKTLSYLALLHLSETRPRLNISVNEIKVSLRNNTNIDELENLETQDLMISSLNNFKDVVDNLQSVIENSSYEVNSDLIIENVIDSLANSGSMFHIAFKKRSPEVEFSDEVSNSDDSSESDTSYDDTEFSSDEDEF